MAVGGLPRRRWSARCPAGRRLAGRPVGGARVTAAELRGHGRGASVSWSGLPLGSFGLFFAAFLVLFVASGVGNGSTYRMIPAIFQAKARGRARRPARGGPAVRQAAGVRGHRDHLRGRRARRLPHQPWRSACRSRRRAARPPRSSAFLAFYLVCVALTWWCYLRTVGVSLVASLAHAPGLTDARGDHDPLPVLRPAVRHDDHAPRRIRDHRSPRRDRQSRRTRRRPVPEGLDGGRAADQRRAADHAAAPARRRARRRWDDGARPRRRPAQRASAPSTAPTPSRCSAAAG